MADKEHVFAVGWVDGKGIERVMVFDERSKALAWEAEMKKAGGTKVGVWAVY